MENVARVIDANLNRCKEGIRVIEDTLRYLHNDTSLTTTLKELRHQIKIKNLSTLLDSRDVANDVAKANSANELKRENLANLILANFKRAQESARVLEEYTKLYHQFGDTQSFKSLRYKLYEIEKIYFETYHKDA